MAEAVRLFDLEEMGNPKRTRRKLCGDRWFGEPLGGWSGERAFPGRGVAVGTRGKSATGKENGCVRSPELQGHQVGG